MGAKLIRDKLADLPWKDESGKKYLRRAQRDGELFGLALAKFFEEVGEMFAAAAHEDNELTEEFADVYTAFEFLVTQSGYTMDEVMIAYRQKLERFGGFEQGVVWDRDMYIEPEEVK